MNKKELMIKIGEIFDKYDPDHKLSMVVTNKITNDIVDLIIMSKNFGIHKPKLCDYIAIITDQRNTKPYAVPLGGENIDDAKRIFDSGYGSLGAKLIDIYRYVDYDNGYGLDNSGKVNYNFSERLMKCFSEKYTQVFDFSIEGKLLPESFKSDVINAGYKVEDTSSTAGRGGLDSIAIEVEREPVDRLNEVVQFVAKKFNIDPSKVEYSKWD